MLLLLRIIILTIRITITIMLRTNPAEQVIPKLPSLLLLVVPSTLHLFRNSSTRLVALFSLFWMKKQNSTKTQTTTKTRVVQHHHHLNNNKHHHPLSFPSLLKPPFSEDPWSSSKAAPSLASPPALPLRSTSSPSTVLPR